MFGDPIHDVTEVQPTAGYRLRLKFSDGTEGEVDVATLVEFRGVFEALRDPKEFRKVFVDAEGGTIAWPTGADLDPIVLYAAVTSRSIEELLSGSPSHRPID